MACRAIWELIKYLSISSVLVQYICSSAYSSRSLINMKFEREKNINYAWPRMTSIEGNKPSTSNLATSSGKSWIHRLGKQNQPARTSFKISGQQLQSKVKNNINTLWTICCREVEASSIESGYATLFSLCCASVMQKGNISPMCRRKHANEQH